MIKKNFIKSFFSFHFVNGVDFIIFFFENHHHQLNKFIRIKMKALDDGENVFSN